MAHSNWQWRFFLHFVRIAIVINVICLGFAAQVKDQQILWDVLEHLFTFIFAAEMVIKIAVMKMSYFKDNWNRLDFVHPTFYLRNG